jgi:isocitrate lyase
LGEDVYYTEGASVEVKVGVTDSPRELVFPSAQTPGEVEELVTAALAKDAAVLSLTDEKGRRFLIPAAKIAYVEIGVADARRVGFGIGSGPATGG